MLRRHTTTFVVAFVTAVVVAGGPAVAGAVYDAINADKVDGFHAADAGANASQRAGKLVATDSSSGRLPDNIIAKAPAAVKADRLGTIEGLVGRPCTKFGQTGTVALRYRGLEDPTVTPVCKGIVGVDPAEPNNTLDKAVWINSSTQNASLSPQGDVDWFRYITSICDPYSLQVEVFDGDADVTIYRGLDDSEELANPTTELMSGEPVTIKVTGSTVTQYRLEVTVYCM